jgi:hypothetical protein
MSIETEATAGELIANEASASARKKTVAAKPKGAPASKTRKSAGRPPRSSRAKPNGSSHLSLNRRVPMQIRRRGVELRLVINGGASASGKTDQALLRAVARAHCWFDDLASGRCGSMVEIARRDGVGKMEW